MFKAMRMWLMAATWGVVSWAMWSFNCVIWNGWLDGMTGPVIALGVASAIGAVVLWIFGVVYLFWATEAMVGMKHAFWRPLMLVLFSVVMIFLCLIFSYHATAMWGGEFTGLIGPAGILSAVFGASGIAAGVTAVVKIAESVFPV